MLPYEKRYKSAHVAKILRCNWKVAQEAFSEAYHVIATHPQILGGIGDSNTKYDVFGNYSRAISPQGFASPHLQGMPEFPSLEGVGLYTKLRHPLSGAIYERHEDGYVHVTAVDGRSGRFTDGGHRVDGTLGQVDPNMCDWIGGKQLPDYENAPLPPWLNGDVPEYSVLRKMVGDLGRQRLRPFIGDDVEQVSDAANVAWRSKINSTIRRTSCLTQRRDLAVQTDTKLCQSDTEMSPSESESVHFGVV